MKKPPAKPIARFWRIARLTFRWCRIVVWLFILAVLCLLIWLHRYGLPEFAREMVVTELRTRGVDMRFARMRLVWHRGVVAEQVELGRSSGTNGVSVSAAEASLHLRMRRLWHGELDVEGVALRDGRVVVPIWGTNDRPHELAFAKVNGELKFLAGDTWELGGLRAECFGVPMRLAGTVSNALELRDWKFGQDRPQDRTAAAFWHDLIGTLDRTRFAGESELMASFTGDARRVESFRANLHVRSARIDAPTWRGSNVVLSAQILPRTGALVYVEYRLDAQEAHTRWGDAGSVRLRGNVAPSLTRWAPTNAHLELQVRRAQTAWGQAAGLTLKVSFRPNPSDAGSALAEYSLLGQQVVLPWGRFARAELEADGVVAPSNGWPRTASAKLNFAGGDVQGVRAAAGDIEATLALPAWADLKPAGTNASWWPGLNLVSGDVKVRLTGLNAPRVHSTNLSLAAKWEPPLLTLRDVVASGFGGELRGSAELDTVTRLLSIDARTDFDPKEAVALLGTNLVSHLADFDWARAPRAGVVARVTLPPWTNAMAWRGVDWPRDVLPALALTGNVELGPGSYRGIAVSLARTDFTFSNRVWRVPNLSVTRPGEEVRVAHVLDEATGEFSVVIDSSIHPRLLRPWLAPAALEVLDEFTISLSPVIRAEIAGRLGRLETITARGSFAATNFAYRQRPVQWARSEVTFTNSLLTFHAPEVQRAEGTGRADSVAVDVARGKIYLNNAVGRLHVADVTHAITPVVEETMAPYRFIDAPHGRVNGVIDAHDETKCNLRFQVEGGAFEWRQFKLQRFTSDVHWAGSALMFSNTVGVMHGGLVDFSAAFDFTAPKGVGFAFQTQARDLDFHSLMTDLDSPTNKLEGTLNGLLTITRANTEEPLSWFGSGYATLRDGLIWDVPAFGLFSPIINTIKPGAGNSRAREVNATFLITNSVVVSDDLVIHASGMRLKYEGTVDFDGRLNARLEAQLFRNTPGLGPVVSTVLWPFTKLFEYKVTGTLARPRSQPLYIPKVFMVPFHPVRSLKELLGEDKEPGPAPER